MTNRFIALGINIDHVATLRQARRARYPDPVHAALAQCLEGRELNTRTVARAVAVRTRESRS